MYQNVLAVSETLCKVDGGDVSSWREVPVDSELQMGLGGGMGWLNWLKITKYNDLLDISDEMGLS